MLPLHYLVEEYLEKFGIQTNHARAWKRVPAESDAIAILDIAPLIFQRFVVHVVEAVHGPR
jgi:hypothetical protein